MDTSRFQNAFDEFQLHDLVAKFAFKSATSISFATRSLLGYAQASR